VCERLRACGSYVWFVFALVERKNEPQKAYKKAVGVDRYDRPRPVGSANAETMAYTWAQYGWAVQRRALPKKCPRAGATSHDVLSYCQLPFCVNMSFENLDIQA